MEGAGAAKIREKKFDSAQCVVSGSGPYIFLLCCNAGVLLLQIAPIILPLTNDMRTMRNMGPPAV